MKQSISDFVTLNLPRKIGAINYLQCLYSSLDYPLPFAFSLARKFVFMFPKSQKVYHNVHNMIRTTNAL